MDISPEHFLIWIFTLAAINAFRPRWNYYDIYNYVPKIEMEHDPLSYTSTISPTINGSSVTVPSPLQTPDFRIEETFYTRYYHYKVIEEERPYRVSPITKQIQNWYGRDNPAMMGCTCTTVYKKTKMLATCAVLTVRHVLTTATSTEIILRKRRHFKHLQNILGVWYEHNHNSFNSSMYGTPARIHYHPRYVRPYDVNRSHPIPAMYDLSLWTMTHRLYKNVCTCERGSSHWWSYGSPVPDHDELALIVGFQFMKAFKRVPMPWMKYAVRTRKHVQPCPKTEWGWFHCMKGNWAKLGLDSGANMHRALQGRYWRYDGLIGINAFSMRLRSYDMVHYFTVLDQHQVINFLYNCYNGLLDWEFLDYRFQNVRYQSLKVIGEEIYWNWELPDTEHYSGYDLPNYK